MILTAKEAREVAGPRVSDYVEEACQKIRDAATQKKFEVRLNSTFWETEGYSNTQMWRDVKTQLEELGFTVKFYYEERQFVNMGTVISW